MKKILGLFILGIVVFASPVFSDNPPPELDPAEVSAQGHFLIRGNWAQLKRGWNTLVLQITDSESKTATHATVKVTYDMVTMPMNPPDNPVEERENGTYEKKIFLGMKGPWKFKTEISGEPLNDTHEKVQNIKN